MNPSVSTPPGQRPTRTLIGATAEQEARKLAGLEGQREDELAGVKLRQATIIAYDSGTKLATITLGGDSTSIAGVRSLGSYTPNTGDTGVWALMLGTSPLLIGAVGGGGGQAHAGTFSGTTNSTGYQTVTHGAGFTPSVVVVQPTNPHGGTTEIPVGIIVSAIGPTTFEFRALNQAGGALSSDPVDGGYVCYP